MYSTVAWVLASGLDHKHNLFFFTSASLAHILEAKHVSKLYSDVSFDAIRTYSFGPLCLSPLQFVHVDYLEFLHIAFIKILTSHEL